MILQRQKHYIKYKYTIVCLWHDLTFFHHYRFMLFRQGIYAIALQLEGTLSITQKHHFITSDINCLFDILFKPRFVIYFTQK